MADQEVVAGELVGEEAPPDSALAVRDEPEASVTLFHTNDPVQIIERASALAGALSKVINAQNLFTMISERKHVRVEGWTLLGTMLGVYPVIEWTRAMPNDAGFEARCVAKTRDGEEIGAAEAMCTRGENKWKGRDSYALRSMAQTRAISKALRAPLGFVMTLAGYDPLPQEEVDEQMAREGEAPRVTDNQIKKLHAVARELGLAHDDLHQLLHVASLHELNRETAKAAIDDLERQAKAKRQAAPPPATVGLRAAMQQVLGEERALDEIDRAGLDKIVGAMGVKNRLVKNAQTTYEKIDDDELRQALLAIASGA